jgi:protein gp37
MAPQWATSLRDQCQQDHIPFFFKQWGEYAPTGYLVIGATSKGTLLAGDPVDDLGHRVELARVGKKNAGRELEGRAHDAFPAVTR